MARWLKFFLDVCLLKAGPQNAPVSKIALKSATLAYWALGVSILLFSYELAAALIVASVQTALAIFFFYMALWIKKEPARITQTLTAYMGAGIIVLVASIPLFSWVGQDQTEFNEFYFIIWLGLLAWETAVTAHILRHALSIHIAAGVGVALIFMYLTFAVTLRFVKILSFELN